MTPANTVWLACFLSMPGLASTGTSAVFFLEDRGGAPSSTRYVAKGGLTADFRPAEVVLHLPGEPVRMRFLGASHTRPEGRGRTGGQAHFLFGARAVGWINGVAAYAEVVYRDLYPGIDMAYGGSGRKLKSEFRLKAGADPGLIRWRYTGAGAIRLEPDGGLLLPARSGEFREARPEIYQERGGGRIPIQGAFEVSADGSVGFRLGAYDRSAPLVIDPVIMYSTYLGGSGSDNATAITSDAAGNVYVAGWTDSTNFPTTNAFRSHTGGGVDAFVAKWNPVSGMVYCTYIGGSLEDRALGIAVDTAGNAYVTGSTMSTNFPVAGAYQAGMAGARDAFLLKLSPTGSLLYSTYLGGGGSDIGYAVAVDGSGNAYVAGETASSNFPTRNPYQSSNRGGVDAFLTKFSSAGNQLFFSTYLGGFGDDRARGIAVDGSGTIFLTGGTASTNFPTVNAVQAANGGSQDVFAARFTADGAALLYSTYLGGTGGASYPECGAGVAVDAAGNAYLTGTASSANFPLSGAAQARFGGSADAFVTKLGPSGAMVYSTFLGGSSLDYGQSIAVDAQGSATVAGYTASIDFPVIGAVQASSGGAYDAFLVKVAPDGLSFLQSTFFGGSAIDSASAVSVGSNGNTYLAGQTASTNFPLKNAAQPLFGGLLDAFFARFSPPTSYQGYLDSSDCGFITGWAWDRNQPDSPIFIDIYDGANLIATVAADQFRQDVKNAGYGNGYHGFRYATPASLRDGQTHIIRAKFPQTSTDLGFTPRSVLCTGAQGFHDTVGCSYSTGWAWYQNQPDTPVVLDILDGTVVIATVTANVYRQDLKNGGIGNGYHGFIFPTPTSMKNGQAHSMRVRFAGTAINLALTPRSLTCAATQGFHDWASCSSIVGWAWDRNLPVTPISVDIYDGARFLASTLANEFRLDLKNVGYGDGYHGFTYPTPAQLKDGAVHSIRVRIGGTGDDVGATPRSLTCPAP